MVKVKKTKGSLEFMSKKATRRDVLKYTGLFMGSTVLGDGLLNSAKAFAEDRSSFLLVPPFLGRPTQESITVNLVAGDQEIVCHLKYGKVTESKVASWQKTEDFIIKAKGVEETVLSHLEPGTHYKYQVFVLHGGSSVSQLADTGSFRTQRIDHEPFNFAVISDSHITPLKRDFNRFDVLRRASGSISVRKPEFMMMLGDNIQTFSSYHGGHLTDPEFGSWLYLVMRKGLGDLVSSTPAFLVNGNWEGENSWHPEKERGWARQARMAFIPNPDNTTYPEGGSAEEDFYGFTWGNALCLVLNVTGYNSSDHRLNTLKGRADDWTLGKKQRDWLHDQLSLSDAKWKFLFMHHTVAGKGGDEINSRYGRGGGRAFNVGEQSRLQDMMKEFGVQILFYGHDHVFTDIIVENIHYTCVGSAGAPWKFDTNDTGYKKYWTQSGYTWVEVKKDSVKVSFVKANSKNTEGEILHTYEITENAA